MSGSISVSVNLSGREASQLNNSAATLPNAKRRMINDRLVDILFMFNLQSIVSNVSQEEKFIIIGVAELLIEVCP